MEVARLREGEGRGGKGREGKGEEGEGEKEVCLQSAFTF